ncbi:MAG: hypothetical protein L0Y61_03750 [Epsilonproteobacteria bacterium]|nr:hypothetical protein [Campylobacterota bacterium]
MKRNLLAVGLLFGATSIYASNENFIGVGTGNGKATMKMTAIGTIDGESYNLTLSERDSARITSIVGGTIIDDKHKLSIGYSKYNTEDGTSMNSIDLGYSYYLNQSDLQIQNPKWKPFVSLGYMMNSYSVDIEDTTLSIDIDTKALMLGVGTDYKIDERSFLTMGYDFSLSTSGSENFSYEDNDFSVRASVEFDKMSRLYIGYNYKF